MAGQRMTLSCFYIHLLLANYVQSVWLCFDACEHQLIRTRAVLFQRDSSFRKEPYG
jgi:hypothetical protein